MEPKLTNEKAVDKNRIKNRKKKRQNKIINVLIHSFISAVLMIGLVAAVYLTEVPNPNMILITGLMLGTSVYGYCSGITCGLIMIIYSMYFFSVDHRFFEYTEVNREKMTVIVIGVIMNVFFIGHLKKKQNEANDRLRELNQMLVNENRTLGEMTRTDALTGVNNRFALIRDYVIVAGKEVLLVMLDVDDFKEINDRYGHGAGDHVLKKLGNTLKSYFGEESTYRYGGDEFTVVLPEMKETQFLETLELFRKDMATVHYEGEQLSVRCSAGYVSGKIGEPEDINRLMIQADEKLYQNKEERKKRQKH